MVDNDALLGTEEMADFLLGVNGFKAIPRENLLELCNQLKVTEFAFGEHLIIKGDAGTSMYVIHSGTASVFITGDAEDLKLTAHLGPGDILGEMALLTGAPRSADVLAESDVVALVFERETLQPFLHAHPALANFLTELVAIRIQEDLSFQLVGKYQILKQMGKGSTAIVYEAFHKTLDRLVAVKMLSHSLAYDEAFQNRFINEAKTIANLSHPNIIEVFDTELSYGTHFIFMEMAKGTTLDKYLKEKGPLSSRETARILAQVATALSYAHSQGIVHRDIKPENCIVDERLFVKLMDFGIAHRSALQGQEVQTIEGSPLYMAPEVIGGKMPDGRADIYSLGVMGYQLLTGTPPFKGKSVMEILKAHLWNEVPPIRAKVPGVSTMLARFLDGAMKKDPDERVSDWNEVLSLLFLAGGATVRTEDGTSDDLSEVSIRFPKDQTEKVLGALSGISGIRILSSSGLPISLGPPSRTKA